MDIFYQGPTFSGANDSVAKLFSFIYISVYKMTWPDLLSSLTVTNFITKKARTRLPRIIILSRTRRKKRSRFISHVLLQALLKELTHASRATGILARFAVKYRENYWINSYQQRHGCANNPLCCCLDLSLPLYLGKFLGGFWR